MRAAVPERKGRFAALQSRNFTLLWLGLIVSNAGTWMQNVANGWLVLQLTNSPLWLGLLGLSFALPMMVLPLVGGAVVDRVHRIKLLYITQTASMLVAFALAILTWLNLVTVWHIFAASFLGAALLAFDNPARQALLPELVPPGDLLNALSLNSATYNGAALIGPALAGALLVPLGAGTLFFLNGVSFLAVIFALMGMKDVRAHSGGKPGSLRSSMGAGLTYAWSNRLVFVLLLLSALAAFFGRSYQTLLPIFARDIWQTGPEGYGALLSAGGAGALVGAFGLAAVSNLKRRALVLDRQRAAGRGGADGVRAESRIHSRRQPAVCREHRDDRLRHDDRDHDPALDTQRDAGPRDEPVRHHAHRLAIAGGAWGGFGCRASRRYIRRAPCRAGRRGHHGRGTARVCALRLEALGVLPGG